MVDFFDNSCRIFCLEAYVFLVCRFVFVAFLHEFGKHISLRKGLKDKTILDLTKKFC